MKQLTIISGKGGTGKTTITASFAALAREPVIADCDVDAADLHIVLGPVLEKKEVFIGLKVASRDAEKCISCGRCLKNCRFGAVTPEYDILYRSCEGCGVCEYVCPADAIEMIDRKSGFSYISSTRFGPMSHAKLFTAEEASGKLVAVVRNNARLLAEENCKDIVIIDGPPGIGCPVISAITGVDMVLVVTEPTISGIHDLQRILDVAEHFNVPALVCVNKSDVNFDNVAKIEEYCSTRGVEIVGKLPYDDSATKAMIWEKSVVELSDSKLSMAIREMWARVEAKLK